MVTDNASLSLCSGYEGCYGHRSDAGQQRTFTLTEIKVAFWEEFHEKGELFFPYPAMGISQQECDEVTEGAWADFVTAMIRELTNGKLGVKP